MSKKGNETQKDEEEEDCCVPFLYAFAGIVIFPVFIKISEVVGKHFHFDSDDFYN